jgi:hypothetical protein
MKIATRARFATILFATFLFAASAFAQPTDNMIGTWECRQPGVQYGNKPPILYVEGSITKDSSKATFALEIDGFVREVYGFSEVTADADGWWRITPKQGEAFMVRPEGVTKSRTASMALRRAGASYRCLRLPLTGTKGVQPLAPPSPQSPGTLNIPPSDAQSEEPAKKE